jgi:hypothetical protein
MQRSAPALSSRLKRESVCLRRKRDRALCSLASRVIWFYSLSLSLSLSFSLALSLSLSLSRCLSLSRALPLSFSLSVTVHTPSESDPHPPPSCPFRTGANVSDRKGVFSVVLVPHTAPDGQPSAFRQGRQTSGARVNLIPYTSPWRAT